MKVVTRAVWLAAMKVDLSVDLKAAMMVVYLVVLRVEL